MAEIIFSKHFSLKCEEVGLSKIFTHKQPSFSCHRPTVGQKVGEQEDREKSNGMTINPEHLLAQQIGNRTINNSHKIWRVISKCINEPHPHRGFAQQSSHNHKSTLIATINFQRIPRRETSMSVRGSPNFIVGCLTNQAN